MRLAMDNRNGHGCPRCVNGTLIHENGDALCLNCGWRLSTDHDQGTAQRYSEAIVARLLHNGCGDMNDIEPRHCKLAGLAG